MATVRPEGTGDKIVTLEELALAYDTLNGTKIAKDISQLDSIVGDPASTDYFMLGRNGVEYKVDYDALATAIINKLGLPLSVANGGSGLSASPSLLTNLASSSAANVMQASPRPGVTGTLPVANGGTGSSSASGALTNLGAAPLSRVNRSNVTSDITLSTEEGTFSQYSAYKSGSIVFIAFTFKPSVAKSAGQSYNFSLTYSSENAGLRPATRSYSGGAGANAIHHVAIAPDTTTHAYIYVSPSVSVAANSSAFWVTVPYICYE